MQINNLNDVFVFQKGGRFVKLPLYQLMLVSDIHEHIQRVLNDSDFEKEIKNSKEYISAETEELFEELERLNRLRAIDIALDERDEETFNKLLEGDKSG